MAWYDKLLAFAAPASYRAVEAVNNDNALKNDLAQFQANPLHRVDPTKYDNPEFAIAAQGHLDALTGKQQAREAAPILQDLAAFSRDPAYQTPEALQVLAQEGNPLGTTQKNLVGAWEPKPGLDNPVVRQGISDFAQSSQTTLDALLAARGDAGAQARIASRSKDPSVGLKDVSMAAENYGKMRTGEDDREQTARAAQDIARLDTLTYGDANTTPPTAVRQAIANASKGYTSPAALAMLSKFAEDVDKQWTGQSYKRNTTTIGTGDATKKIVEITDPLGKFVKTEDVTNHPRAGKEVDPQIARPEYFATQQDPGIPPIIEHVPYNEDPNSTYQRLYKNDTTGRVFPVTDKNRIASIKALKSNIPKPKKGGGAFSDMIKGGAAPAAAPAPTGGFTYVNGKMVAN